MKQLTRVVERRQSLGGDVGTGGQQHLGQHSGADPPQMSHSQLCDISEPKVGQDLLCRGTLGAGHMSSDVSFVHAHTVSDVIKVP